MTLTYTNTNTHKHTPIPDKPYNASVDVVLREDAQTASVTAALLLSGAASSQRNSASRANDEYINDSLEESNRNNSDGIEGDDNNDTIEQDSLFDTAVEQDSLETSKVAMSIETNDGNDFGGGGGDGSGIDANGGIGGRSSQFLPFAHIGTNWSNDNNTAAQINTDDDHNCSNNTTNQFIEIESTNQTNAFDVQTNRSSIITEQTSENNFHDLPGIYTIIIHPSIIHKHQHQHYETLLHTLTVYVPFLWRKI